MTHDERSGIMQKYVVLTVLSVLSLKAPGQVPLQQAWEKPNILLILADDMGYGDLSCYGATNVLTPNIDRLAKEGILFTDGHAGASTCTFTKTDAASSTT